MGRLPRPLPAKLIAGLIGDDAPAHEQALKILGRTFGPTDYCSPVFGFDITYYYAAEMGPALKRTFVSFRRLIRPEQLAAVKIKTNAIEERLAASGRRRVNIDPGYVSSGKLVLATTKNHAHRIYAGRGVYAEVTLVFRNGSFAALAHTYPDYRQETHIEVFNAIRRLYAQQIQETYGHAALSRCP